MESFVREHRKGKKLYMRSEGALDSLLLFEWVTKAAPVVSAPANQLAMRLQSVLAWSHCGASTVLTSISDSLSVSAH